jgi:nucleotide-binding universal stress UspA family protein
MTESLSAGPPRAETSTLPSPSSRSPAREPQPYRPILVGLGSTTLGEDKLSPAKEYARALGAEVVLLHVSPTASDTSAVPHALAMTRAYMDTLAANLEAAGVRATVQLRHGRVAEAIVAEALSLHASMIILGANTRSGLVKAVTGSIADAVVRAAPCPVVLVRPSRPPAAAPPLLSFDTAASRAGALRRRPPQLQSVEVARIVGSVGRVAELGADFRPARRARRGIDEQRLDRLRAAMAQQQRVPPVDLYQLGFGYYVLDGHHRVAAARLLGQVEIDASVVRFDAQTPRLSSPKRAWSTPVNAPPA